MTFDYIILALSVILLLIPRPCLQWGQLSRANKSGSSSSAPASASSASSSSQHRRRRRKPSPTRTEFVFDYRLETFREIKNPHNWIDFLRAAVGSFGLFITGITGTDLVDVPLAESGPYITAQIVVAAIAVLAQMVRIEKSVMYYAPVFFIQGLMFGLVDWRVGLLTMLGIWTITPLLHTPAPFLALMGIVAAAFGALLHVHWIYLLTALGITLGPVLWTILFHQRLIASMERKHLRSFAYQKNNDIEA